MQKVQVLSEDNCTQNVLLVATNLKILRPNRCKILHWMNCGYNREKDFIFVTCSGVVWWCAVYHTRTELGCVDSQWRVPHTASAKRPMNETRRFTSRRQQCAEENVNTINFSAMLCCCTFIGYTREWVGSSGENKRANRRAEILDGKWNLLKQQLGRWFWNIKCWASAEHISCPAHKSKTFHIRTRKTV